MVSIMILVLLATQLLLTTNAVPVKNYKYPTIIGVPEKNIRLSRKSSNDAFDVHIVPNANGVTDLSGAHIVTDGDIIIGSTGAASYGGNGDIGSNNAYTGTTGRSRVKSMPRRASTGDLRSPASGFDQSDFDAQMSASRAKMDADRDAFQAKMEADRIALEEKMANNRKRMEDDSRKFQEKMDASRASLWPSTGNTVNRSASATATPPRRTRSVSTPSIPTPEYAISTVSDRMARLRALWEGSGPRNQSMTINDVLYEDRNGVIYIAKKKTNLPHQPFLNIQVISGVAYVNETKVTNDVYVK